MSSDIWRLFPYPTLHDGEIVDGSVLPAHPVCLACRARLCEDSIYMAGQVSVCRYGLSFVRIDETRLVVGVVATEESTTQRAKKRLRREPGRRIKSIDLRTAVAGARRLGPGAVEDFEQAKEYALGRMSKDEGLHRAVAEKLRRDFDDNLSQSHDFMQLVKLVRGHAESLLHAAHPEMKPDEAAEKMPTEGAIYFSTELMLLKMDSLRFLRESNLAIGNEKRFHVHPLILKYVRIYRWQAAQKEMQIRLDGQCFAASSYNSAAMGAVVQGLLDNMVKYAPAGSGASIVFEESDRSVTVSFVSLGPKIEDAEINRIFLPGYRGSAAKTIDSSGLGVGLASAKAISDVLDLGLSVSQETESDAKYADRYLTTFTLTLQRVP